MKWTHKESRKNLGGREETLEEKRIYLPRKPHTGKVGTERNRLPSKIGEVTGKTFWRGVTSRHFPAGEEAC